MATQDHSRKAAALHPPPVPHPADMMSDSAFKSIPVVAYRRVSSIDAASSLDGLALLAVRVLISQMPSNSSQTCRGIILTENILHLVFIGHSGFLGLRCRAEWEGPSVSLLLEEHASFRQWLAKTRWQNFSIKCTRNVAFSESKSTFTVFCNASPTRILSRPSGKGPGEPS